jgi:hypothetical protein
MTGCGAHLNGVVAGIAPLLMLGSLHEVALDRLQRVLEVTKLGLHRGGQRDGGLNARTAGAIGVS